MSKLFYDRFIVLDEVETKIDTTTKTVEEREEMWALVDGIVHNRVLTVILGKLPRKHHEDFMARFLEKPHDEGLFEYLRDKVENAEALLEKSFKNYGHELIEEIWGKEGQNPVGEKK